MAQSENSSFYVMYYGKKDGFEFFYDTLPAEFSHGYDLIGAVELDTFAIDLKPGVNLFGFQREHINGKSYDFISIYEFSLDVKRRSGYHAVSLMYPSNQWPSDASQVYDVLIDEVESARLVKESNVSPPHISEIKLNPKPPESNNSIIDKKSCFVVIPHLEEKAAWLQLFEFYAKNDLHKLFGSSDHIVSQSSNFDIFIYPDILEKNFKREIPHSIQSIKSLLPRGYSFSRDESSANVIQEPGKAIEPITLTTDIDDFASSFMDTTNFPYLFFELKKNGNIAFQPSINFKDKSTHIKGFTEKQIKARLKLGKENQDLLESQEGNTIFSAETIFVLKSLQQDTSQNQSSPPGIPVTFLSIYESVRYGNHQVIYGFCFFFPSERYRHDHKNIVAFLEYGLNISKKHEAKSRIKSYPLRLTKYGYAKDEWKKTPSIATYHLSLNNVHYKEVWTRILEYISANKADSMDEGKGYRLAFGKVIVCVVKEPNSQKSPPSQMYQYVSAEKYLDYNPVQIETVFQNELIRDKEGNYFKLEIINDVSGEELLPENNTRENTEKYYSNTYHLPELERENSEENLQVRKIFDRINKLPIWLKAIVIFLVVFPIILFGILPIITSTNPTPTNQLNSSQDTLQHEYNQDGPNQDELVAEKAPEDASFLSPDLPPAEILTEQEISVFNDANKYIDQIKQDNYRHSTKTINKLLISLKKITYQTPQVIQAIKELTRIKAEYWYSGKKRSEYEMIYPYYQVKASETLFQISYNFNISMEDIAKDNPTDIQWIRGEEEFQIKLRPDGSFPTLTLLRKKKN